MIEPLRTSPAANTPGRLVSKRYGSRKRGRQSTPPSAERSNSPPRQDEAALVELDGPFKPAGVGLRTDEDEEGTRSEGSLRAPAVVLDHDPLKAVLSHELPDLRVGEQLDVLGVNNPVDEIPGHGLV